jgi:hypothetical protein
VAVVSVEQVERHQPDGLLGCWLDAPRPGDLVPAYALEVRGWAVGGDCDVEGFQVRNGGRVLGRVAPNRPRPDVAERLPELPVDGIAGFEMVVSGLELEPSFEVEVVARLGDGSTESLATLRGSRTRMVVPRRPRLNPLMITTIGRSGSKWLSLLLGRHPALVAFQPLVFEPRVATYWATVLRSLASPRSYLRQIHTEHLGEKLWWVGEESVGVPWPLELGIGDWLGAEAVHELAAICQQRVETFYLHVAERAGRRGARYFVEKFPLEPALLDLTLECFPAAREVILVRDFRDRLSSVFAWNERQGDAGFGHEGGMSKARYVAEKVLADAEGMLERWRARGDAAHLVRYEELVTDPERALGEIFEHVGVASDATTVAAVIEGARREGALLDGHRTVRDPMETIGRWRRDLPADLAEACNAVLGEVLEAFGYSTEATPSEELAR